MTSIEATVERLQDEGRNIYIWGWTPDGRRCLVVVGDEVAIASKDSANSVGRHECSKQHLAENADHYGRWFPMKSSPTTVDTVSRFG